MNFAIVKSGGKQFRVEKGATLRVPLMEKQAGDTVDLDVLLAGGDGETKLGTPFAPGVSVSATVIGHGRDAKIVVFKKKRRKHYKRKQGHRQDYTTLRIDSID
jgi:large subunit ribosomal protein L21